MSERKMRTAVVGAGIISEIYLKNMINTFNNLEIVAVCAAHLDHAQKRAEQFGIKACTYEEILSDPTIEMVVVLTPTPTHYGLIRQALEAGKHAYTEKVMTLEKADALELVRLSEEKGKYLGAAPDTFLGAALQTARRELDDGRIGDVTGFAVNATRDVDRLAGMFSFIRMPGGGVNFDYGVYYMTALVSLLGPVKRVFGVVRNLQTTRPNMNDQSPEFGQLYEDNNESQVFAILEMESGVMGTFCINGDTVRKDLADFKLYGKEGVLQLTDPNYFGGDVVFYPRNYQWGGESCVIENTLPFSENSRGIGPSEMAWSIEHGVLNRANKYVSYHVLDTLCRIVDSSESGKFEEVASTCTRPAPFTIGRELLK